MGQDAFIIWFPVEGRALDVDVLIREAFRLDSEGLSAGKVDGQFGE